MKTCNCCKIEKDKSYFKGNKKNCKDCQHLKFCPSCTLVKTLDAFSKSSRGRCKKCFNKLTEERKKRNGRYNNKQKIKQEKRQIRLKEERKIVREKRSIRTKEQSKILKRLRWSVHRIFKEWYLTKIKSSYEYLNFSKQDFLNKFPFIPENYDIDHKIPLSWFILDTPISIMFDLENLQLLPREENQIKGNNYYSPISEEYMEKIIPFINTEYLIKFGNLNNSD